MDDTHKNHKQIHDSQKEDFPQRYVERLFGKHVSVDEAMAALDEDGNGEVRYVIDTSVWVTSVIRCCGHVTYISL